MEKVGDDEYSKKDLIGHGAFAVVFKGKSTNEVSMILFVKVIINFENVLIIFENVLIIF